MNAARAPKLTDYQRFVLRSKTVLIHNDKLAGRAVDVDRARRDTVVLVAEEYLVEATGHFDAVWRELEQGERP
jgi:hypothetical protein